MQPVKIFISYAHADESFMKDLSDHLSVLERNNIIAPWYDRKVTAGEKWDKEIKKNLEEADIILFLVSSKFMASDYIHDVEIAKAIENHKKGTTLIVPIIIKSCHFQDLKIGKFQALPKDALPIEKWDFLDDAYCDVVEQLKKLIQVLREENKEQPLTAKLESWQQQIRIEANPKKKGVSDYDRLSCDRKKVVSRFFRYFDKWKEEGINNQLYFLAGQRYAQSDSLIQRLVIELNEKESLAKVRKLNEKEIVTISSNSNLDVEDIEYNIRKSIHTVYGLYPHVKILYQLLDIVDKYPSVKKYNYFPIVLEIKMLDSCWEKRIQPVLNWLIDEFAKTNKQYAQKFVFFVIVKLHSKDQKKKSNLITRLFRSPKKSPSFNIFEKLKLFLTKKQNAILLPRLSRVDRQDLDDWYLRFERNDREREKKVDELVTRLGNNDSWDMSAVELELAEIVNFYQNEKHII